MEATNLDTVIRSRVNPVVLGEATPEEFEDWFVGATWDDRTDLVAKIEYLLAERGLLTEAEFRAELGRIVATVWVGEPHSFSTGLSNASVRPERMIFGAGDVTIRRQMAFAGS